MSLFFLLPSNLNELEYNEVVNEDDTVSTMLSPCISHSLYEYYNKKLNEFNQCCMPNDIMASKRYVNYFEYINILHCTYKSYINTLAPSIATPIAPSIAPSIAPAIDTKDALLQYIIKHKDQLDAIKWQEIMQYNTDFYDLYEINKTMFLKKGGNTPLNVIHIDGNIEKNINNYKYLFYINSNKYNKYYYLNNCAAGLPPIISPPSYTIFDTNTTNSHAIKFNYYLINTPMDSSEPPIKMDYIYVNIYNNLTENISTIFSQDYINEYTKEISKAIIFILKNQQKGGTSILKIGHVFYKPIIDCIYIICKLFAKVHICKPCSSNMMSYEKYIICHGYKNISSNKDIDILENWLKIAPMGCSPLKADIPLFFSNKLNEINIILGHKQITTLEDIILIFHYNNKEHKLDNIKKQNINKYLSWYKTFILS